VSLAALVEETASLALHDSAVQRITFELAIRPGADTVYADPVLLQQVMFNLMRNAAEAMAGAGGRIEVRASMASQDEVVIQVQDTGPGLDQEVAANLFTAFVSTKGDGMGVGLSICRTIIENNGGRIWAESSGAGTSFFFTLPRTRSSVNEAQPAPAVVG
jgi:two-component system sensor kinase FixL